MLPALVVLFVVVPLLELAVILQVGREIGVWPTVGLLVAASILGSVLMRTQGRAAWRRFAQTARSGRPPAREILDGALIVGGGALLLTPGFLSDLLGVLLLLPPSRAVVRRILSRQLTQRMVASMTVPRTTTREQPGDFEGTASTPPAPDNGTQRPL